MSIFANINIIEVLQWTGLLLFGMGMAYYRTNAKLQTHIAFLISRAEEAFVGVKVGGKRFAWVCDTLYNAVPLPLKAIITRQMIEQIVQGTFDAMAAYAKTQLDRLVDTAIPGKVHAEEK